MLYFWYDSLIGEIHGYVWVKIDCFCLSHLKTHKLTDQGWNERKTHRVCAWAGLQGICCTTLVFGFPWFAGVRRFNLWKMFHQQELTHQRWAFEILVSTTPSCPRRLRRHQINACLALRRRRDRRWMGWHDGRHRCVLANLVPSPKLTFPLRRYGPWDVFSKCAVWPCA